jgi:hypothetical protein
VIHKFASAHRENVIPTCTVNPPDGEIEEYEIEGYRHVTDVRNG